MDEVEFLIDENILGIDRYLANKVKYKKVGDVGCPALETSDANVANFAQTNNMIIVTNDEKLVKQCKQAGIKYVTLDLIVDLAKKVLEYRLS